MLVSNVTLLSSLVAHSLVCSTQLLGFESFDHFLPFLKAQHIRQQSLCVGMLPAEISSSSRLNVACHVKKQR